MSRIVENAPQTGEENSSLLGTQSHVGTQSHPPYWLVVGCLILLGLVAANLFSWRTIDPDLWGHIQYGEDWLTSGTLPRHATHTYATPEHPWINHENFFELSVALGQRWFGGHGLMLFKCLAGIWLLCVMVRQGRRRGVPLLVCSVSMIPVAWACAEFWLMRPQLFSFIFFGLMLCAFERAFRNSDAAVEQDPIQFRWLWACIPLLIVWTNSHGGFAAGLCVFVAMLGFRACETWWFSKNGSHLRSRLLHLSLLGLAACLTPLINPYGYELPYWMFMSLKEPRPEISEWANILDSGVTAFPFIALVLLTVTSLCLTRAKRDWVEITVLALIAVQTLGHIRHLPFFAIAFGFWMPQHILSLWQQLIRWRPSLGEHPVMTRNAARMLQVELGLVGIVLVLLLVRSHARFGVDRSEYPVSAIEFMDKEQLHGRLVVTFNWAQYALAALSPKTTVGFDGRYDTCYPQHVVDMHFDLIFGYDPSRRHRGRESGPINPQRVLDFANPNLVMMDRKRDVFAADLLDHHADWVPLYRDGRTGIWGRKSEFDNPSHPNYFPPNRRHFSDATPEGIANWPGFPQRSGRDAFRKTADARVLSSRPLRGLPRAVGG